MGGQFLGVNISDATVKAMADFKKSIDCDHPIKTKRMSRLKDEAMEEIHDMNVRNKKSKEMEEERKSFFRDEENERS